MEAHSNEPTISLRTDNSSNDVETEAQQEDTNPEVLSIDPFAPRKGRTLIWQNVSMTLKGNKKTEPRKLLHNVWGEVPQQQTTAIMGPSGAGWFDLQFSIYHVTLRGSASDLFSPS